VREFCLYGQTTGETDEYGLPVRYPWAEEYRGRAIVVYGHTPVPTPEWVNNTLCVDTGCVFGGRLTALRYPEREIVSVPAERIHYEPAKPFPANPEAAQHPSAARREPEVLDIGDVLGSRVLETAYLQRVGVREENAAAALEVMSRFAVDPRWLLYLPPTMSPVATSTRPDLLEHPDEAFGAYRADGRRPGRLRGEAHGLACGRARVPVAGRGAGSIRRAGRASRRRVDQDRPTVLRRRGHVAVRRSIACSARGSRRVRRARHIVAAAGRGVAALERES
jgi:hypothetical protein